MQYLRILLSTFGEEVFQRFASNFVQIVFGYYFADNVDGTNHLNELELHIHKDYLCVISNHNSCSQSTDLAKLNPYCHMNYLDYL